MFVFDDRIEPGDVIAVGDVHARYDLFSQFLDRVRGSQATVIMLGDLINKGGQDVAVLNKVKELLDDPEREGLANFFCLMGDHEKMLLDAFEKDGSYYMLWLNNGGNFEDVGEIFEHIPWIEGLPIFMTLGDTLFVHGGIYPGKDPLETVRAGRADTLLWMRQPFLSEGPQFEKWNPSLKKVVFGHTVKGPVPYSIPGGGVGINTGAVGFGVLTSHNVTRNTFQQYEV